jgi:hypothetical protein
LPDRGHLEVTTAGPTVVAARTTGVVDLATETSRVVRVAVTCPHEGTSTDVVSASTGGAVARATLDVSCDPPAIRRALPAVLAPLAVLPALPPAPVPAAPAQPALNPQAQVQVQAQAQAQLQMGLQEDEQVAPVLALADDAAPAQAEGIRLEPMSRHRDEPSPAYLTGVLAVATAGAALAVRRQRADPIPAAVRKR